VLSADQAAGTIGCVKSPDNVEGAYIFRNGLPDALARKPVSRKKKLLSCQDTKIWSAGEKVTC